MKRLVTIFASVLALSGCAGFDIGGLADPIVRVAETVTDDSTSSKGITTGMSSSDAREVLINREYYGAIKAVHGAGKNAAGPQLLLDIEPLDGQPIIIQAKRFKVYAPPAQGQGGPQLSIAAPVEKKPTWLAISQEARGWFRDAVVPWKSIDEGGQTERLRITTDGSTRQTELGIMNNAVTGSQDIAGQAITTFKPVVVTMPAAAPSTPEETP